MLLEFCPNGSLVDLLFRKNKKGEFEKQERLPEHKILQILEQAPPLLRRGFVELQNSNAGPAPHELFPPPPLASQVSAGLVHMHSRSPPVTHRDLKLENVLCAADGR